ncbi:MAG: arginine--tRNA ligase [Phycisphaerales bacterium]|nr:MAG: arginine--tRNA ligase [Phycisphaerales bacterium]
MRPIRRQIEQRVVDALAQAFGSSVADVDPQVRAAGDPQFGDFQSNVAMGLAKKLGRKPREIAEALVRALRIEDMCDPPEVAGPGFINLRLRADFLAGQLAAIQSDERLGVPRAVRPEHVALDFSSVNLAKEMHVGHLRSTIVGECLARVLEWLGHDVERINHVGDWGTQFGMLLQHVRETQPEVLETPDSFRVGDLEEFYRRAKARFDEDAAFADAARRAVVDLQGGDPGARTIWQAFCRESLRHCHEIYDRLGVRLEDVGESFYNEMLPGVVAELREMGLAVESEGAVCVFLEGFKNRAGEPLPMIIQKSDGGYNYDTTDLAAARYRIEKLGVRRLIYITDKRQRQHFDMLFAALRKAGWAGDDVSLEHIGFGMVHGEGGRPIKTREGGAIKLVSLLDEAEARARELLEANEKNPETARGFGAEEMAQVARAVGLGAVRYADLLHNLASDYTFSWDKMLAMDGNTAPYMMYAYARVRSIGRKAGLDFAALPAGLPIVIEHPSEVGLAKALLQFAEVIEQVAADLRPNMLTEYLYDLSRTFSTFYDRKTGVRVIDAEPEAVRLCRLRLCDLTARTLKRGLWLLGIETVERM